MQSKQWVSVADFIKWDEKIIFFGICCLKNPPLWKSATISRKVITIFITPKGPIFGIKKENNGQLRSWMIFYQFKMTFFSKTLGTFLKLGSVNWYYRVSLNGSQVAKWLPWSKIWLLWLHLESQKWLPRFSQ